MKHRKYIQGLQMTREHQSMGDIRRSAIETACREYARTQHMYDSERGICPPKFMMSLNHLRKIIDYCMTRQYMEGGSAASEDSKPLLTRGGT
jgi:hypothetical protein